MDDSKPTALIDRLSRGMRSISFQLVALLSLAVLPIGVIAVWQSVTFAQETRRSAEMLLLRLTEESVTLERSLIEAGLRIDPTLIALGPMIGNNQAQCREELAGLISGQPIFQSVAFVPVDGISRCASDGQERDLRLDAAHLRFLEDPVPTVARVDGGMVPVLRVLKPVHRNGALLGYLSVVLQSFVLRPIRNPSGIPDLREVALFNANGTVLTSTLDFQGVAGRLPPDAETDTLLNGPDGYVERTDRTGTNSGFVKVALIPGAVFAIGIWPQENPVSQTDRALARAVGFPLLTWLVGMATALFAARRLVIRPVRMLRDEMRRFARGQRDAAMVLAPGAALEIQDTVNTFNKLELIVARNESALALTAEGKLLLLREVHHRIKNNLQMISSIISIQRRKTIDPEVAKVLRSLQDRVLSIATVDQSLFTTGDVADVRADILIASIAKRLIEVNLEPGHGVQISTRFEVVMLHADQAGPLSLLANEAVTNALKYVGATEIGPPKIEIALIWEDDFIHLSVVNTTRSGLRGAGVGTESSQIGMALIRAFCDQLAAECHCGLDAADLRFHLSVRFRPNRFAITQSPPQDTEDRPQAAMADGVPL